jgi:alpha-tubulin suppressor-like RCC1 family protein
MKLIMYGPTAGKVEHLRHCHIASIACGSAHTAFVTSSGDLYTCGEVRMCEDYFKYRLNSLRTRLVRDKRPNTTIFTWLDA